MTTVVQLQTIIEKHVPASANLIEGSDTKKSEFFAWCIWAKDSFGEDEHHKWSPDHVLAELGSLRRSLAGALVHLNKLPTPVLAALNGSNDDDNPGQRIPGGIYHVLTTALATLDANLQAAQKAACSGDPPTNPEKGKQKWDAIAVFLECSMTWTALTGKMPPKSIGDQSPFGRFVQEIFDALELNYSARSAAAWVNRKSTNSSEN